MKEILNVIAEATGRNAEEIIKHSLKEDGTLTEVAAAYIKDLLADKIKKVSFADNDKKQIADDNYKRGQKETYKFVIKSIGELYPKADVNEDDKWEEVIKKVKATKIEPLKEDDVKLHPAYRELEKNSIPKTELDKIINEFEGYKKQVKRKEVLNNIESILDVNLVDYKLPDDELLKKKRKEIFINQVFADVEDFEQDEKDFILLKNGKRIEDKFSNPITAQKRLIENIPIFFDKKIAGTPKGDEHNNNNNNKTDKTKMPTNIDEFNKIRATLSGKELIEYNQKGTDYLKSKGLL